MNGKPDQGTSLAANDDIFLTPERTARVAASIDDPCDEGGERKEERNSQPDRATVDDDERARCQCADGCGAPCGRVVAAVLEPEQENDCAGRCERSCRAEGAGEGEVPSPARHSNVSVGR